MAGLRPDRWQSLPHVERLLARADRRPEPVGYAAGLLALFGIEPSEGADLPTAALCFLADTGERPGGFVLHADPLELVPDRDCLRAFSLDADRPDSGELAELVGAFNAHFGDDGIRLLCSDSGRLYLYCDRTPSIETTPLPVVVGRDLDPFLPTGAEGEQWRALLNETQMLCHSLPSNQAREATGRRTVGGLWFSGGGGIPPMGPAPVARLVGDDDLARGLLMLGELVGGDDELIVDTAPGRAVQHVDAEAWVGALADLEGRMPHLMRDCDALHLHPGNGTVYTWHARAARRFWRRQRPLVARLDVDGQTPGGRRDAKRL